MSKPITLFCCGDVMTGRGIDQVLPFPGSVELHESYVRDARDYVALAETRNGAIPAPVGFEYLWGDALEELSRFAPDIRLINLETSITRHNHPWPGKGIHYRMHPDNAPVLQSAGINVCSLANNHLLDWGREGVGETLETLDRLGVAHAGAGPDDDAARRPARLITDSGQRVLIWSIGLTDSGIPPDWRARAGVPGVYWAESASAEAAEPLARTIGAEKRPGDLVVISVHWGGNWGYRIAAGHRTFAHRLIDAGADLIHGHSSHHPRGMELYRDRPILYGCGDFINDYEGIPGHEMFRPELTLMYFCRFDGRTGELERFWMTPIRIERFSLHHAEYEEAEWLRSVLQRERQATSPGFTLDRDGRLNWD